jgi:hypothetical protein
VALVAVACSPTPEDAFKLPSLDKPASLASVTSDLSSKLSRYVNLAGQTPPVESPDKLRSFYANEDTALTEARAAFDSWSAYIDKSHAAGKLSFPAGTTWADADNFRMALGLFLDDQREQMTEVKACLEPVAYSAGAADPCIQQGKAANLARWQADQAALVTATQRAGIGNG